VEVECLEIGEGEAVLGVVEEESVLAAVRPAMQALFEFADDIGEVGKCAAGGPRINPEESP
jgi:hypothetical protein